VYNAVRGYAKPVKILRLGVIYMAEKKIINEFTEKSPKSTLVGYINTQYKKVKDKLLLKTIVYAAERFKKDPKSVTQKELLEICKQIAAKTGNITRPVEASSRLGTKSTPLASIFPSDFTLNENKFVAVPFEYQTMGEIRKAVNEEDKKLLFATYWTSRLIKQFDYVNMFNLKKTTNEDVINAFEVDLDIMAPRIVLNEEDTIVAVSAYTEAICLFKGEDLKPVEDTDSDGNKYVLRFSNGMEFQIYELVDEGIDTDTSEEVQESKETEENAEETSEKEEDKESQQPKDEKTSGRKKKFSSKNKKTSDADSDTKDKDNSVDTAE